MRRCEVAVIGRVSDAISGILPFVPIVGLIVLCGWCGNKGYIPTGQTYSIPLDQFVAEHPELVAGLPDVPPAATPSTAASEPHLGGEDMGFAAACPTKDQLGTRISLDGFIDLGPVDDAQGLHAYASTEGCGIHVTSQGTVALIGLAIHDSARCQEIAAFYIGVYGAGDQLDSKTLMWNLGGTNRVKQTTYADESGRWCKVAYADLSLIPSPPSGVWSKFFSKLHAASVADVPAAIDAVTPWGTQDKPPSTTGQYEDFHHAQYTVELVSGYTIALGYHATAGLNMVTFTSTGGACQEMESALRAQFGEGYMKGAFRYWPLKVRDANYPGGERNPGVFHEVRPDGLCRTMWMHDMSLTLGN